MLNDATCFKAIYIVCGYTIYTDLRSGMDRLAAQPPGSAIFDTAAVPLADGRADDHPEKIRQTGGAAGIYGMTLCKTEKFQGSLTASQAAAFRQYTVRHIRLKKGSGG